MIRLAWFYGFVGFNEEFWKALAATRIFTGAMSIIIPTILAIILIIFAVRKVKKFAEEGPFHQNEEI